MGGQLETQQRSGARRDDRPYAALRKSVTRAIALGAAIDEPGVRVNLSGAVTPAW